MKLNSSPVLITDKFARCVGQRGGQSRVGSLKEPPYDTMLTTVVKPGQAQLEFLLLDKKSSRNYANFVGKMSSPAFRPCKYLTLHSFSERIRLDDNESRPI